MKSTDRRYTPAWLVELVVSALGPIKLDPCTESHNPTAAERILTAEDKGDLADWGGLGLTWVNPPFSALLTWTQRVCAEAAAGRELVMLTPIDSTTRWYALLTEHAQLAAPLRRRCKFGFPEGEAQPKSAANSACMLWYLGHRTKRFSHYFKAEAHLFVPGMLGGSP